jgi:ATP-dependent DNA ligase
VKKQRTADCVVGGFRFAAGTSDRVGSLLLGLYDDAGLLDYIGFCSAFPAAERVRLAGRLAPYAGGSGFTGGAPGDAPSRWSRDPERDRSYVALDPQLVLEVQFDQVTGGRIRHGTRPLRWRTDKSPRSCTLDQLAVAGTLNALLA